MPSRVSGTKLFLDLNSAAYGIHDTAKIGHDVPPNLRFLGSYYGHIEKAILYSELGHTEEARAEATEVLDLVPNFSVDVWGERNPMKDRDQVQRDMAALRKAGLK